jgi:hypothetical protein
MSDSLSSDNLGKAFFLAHAVEVYQDSLENAINEWHHEITDIEQAEWAQAANNFCSYLKKAEADS